MQNRSMLAFVGALLLLLAAQGCEQGSLREGAKPKPKLMASEADVPSSVSALVMGTQPVWNNFAKDLENFVDLDDSVFQFYTDPEGGLEKAKTLKQKYGGKLDLRMMEALGNFYRGDKKQALTDMASFEEFTPQNSALKNLAIAGTLDPKDMVLSADEKYDYLDVKYGAELEMALLELMVAEAFFESGMPQSANRFLERAVERETLECPLIRMLVQAKFYNKHFEVKKNLQECLAGKLSYLKITDQLSIKANMAFLAGDWEKSQKAYLEVYGLSSEKKDMDEASRYLAYINGRKCNLEVSSGSLDALPLPEDLSDRAFTLQEMAILAALQGNDKRARKLVNDLDKLKIRPSASFFTKGVMLATGKFWTESLIFLNKAAERAPYSARVRRYRARVFRDRKMLRQAKSDEALADRLDPDQTSTGPEILCAK